MFKLGFLTNMEEINKVVEYLMNYLGANQVKATQKLMTKSFTSKSLSIVFSYFSRVNIDVQCEHKHSRWTEQLCDD